MPAYKLYYFTARGRAETARMILVAADQQFEDIRYERADYPNHAKNFKFGLLPVLDIDGEQLNQSVAIIHFLGTQYGLAGKTPFDAAKCHAIVETIRDLIAPLARSVYRAKDDEERAELIKAGGPDVKKFLSLFEDLIKEKADEKGYLIAGQLTYADFELHSAITTAQNLIGAEALKEFPHVVKHYELISNLPKIKEYLERRPQTTI